MENSIQNPIIIKRLKETAGNEERTGPISHLLYMDDIKLYAKSKKELHKLIGEVKVFSDQIKMKFGLDKCKIVNVV